ncbi:hypothetical protein M758_12G100100 [Ceratodon purpureus]|uniref:Uncharacterized protein n=1 Tax=Ceratodon purpureus TaxID=3225 RepID=A0A8T0G6P0_CERPU|nr:hypothetical protein KC19_12G096200 [Ceratodon purpureus]KAG0598779.1 hypothetical protein M758_12G100100 [Ceratodon purpureus]
MVHFNLMLNLVIFSVTSVISSQVQILPLQTSLSFLVLCQNGSRNLCFLYIFGS